MVKPVVAEEYRYLYVNIKASVCHEPGGTLFKLNDVLIHTPSAWKAEEAERNKIP